MSYTFNDNYVSASVNHVENHKIRIIGKVNNPSNYSRMELLAPNPIMSGMSYSSSGLPFPNPTIAFDETVNRHLISEDGIFTDVIFMFPNGYYVVGGKEKIGPSIFVILHPANGDKPVHIRFEMKDDLPLHTLTYRPNHEKGSLYYGIKESIIEIQGAEATARAYGDAKIRYDIA
jgi:hypothetical protein